MNVGRTVFAQLLDHLPSYEFQKCVTRYRGDYQQKAFSCWDQYLAMAFAQLTYRDSLRDIEACLRSMQGKLCLLYTSDAADEEDSVDLGGRRIIKKKKKKKKKSK